MRQTLSQVSAVLAAVFLLMAGQGLLNLVVVLDLEAAGASRDAIALLTSAYFAGQLLGCLVTPRVVASVGHIRSFSAFSALVAVSALGHALHDDLAWWGLLRMLDGACLAGTLAVIEGWLTDRSPGPLRASVLAVYTVVFYAAVGGGQLLAAVPALDGPTVYVAAGIVLTLCHVPVALTRKQPPDLPSADLMGPVRLLTLAPLGVLAVLVNGALYSGLIGLVPGFAADLGMEEAGVARLMGLALLSAPLAQWPMGRLADRRDRRQVMLGLGLVGAAACLLTSGLALLVPAAVAVGVMLVSTLGATVYPLGLTIISDAVPQDRRVAASATALLLTAVGAIVGPFAAAAFMEALGPAGLFVGGALAFGALAAGGAWRGRLPGPRRVLRFVPLPRTSTVVRHLDSDAPTEEIPR